LAVTPDELYALVSDITRMGEWSPICRACRPQRDPGTDLGTRLTESREFLPPGIAGFRERFGAQADAEIVKRHDAAKSGIPATLAAIKKAAEARP
jgi:ribosome-associated toxin RatA of RatAB toxin-antitoxin module